MDYILELDKWDDHVVSMEELNPGFWERHRLRAMGRLTGGFQFGYEICGYGTVVGHCAKHPSHRTPAEAERCGRRFLNGEPELLRDRIRSLRKAARR